MAGLFLNAARLARNADNRKFLFAVRRILNFTPGNLKLYRLAFIHKSASVTLANGSSVNNERLEYLGDAILDAVVADYLFKNFPSKNEGYLSQMRSKIVKRKYLNALALKIGIEQYIVSNTNNRNNAKHIYGDAFEALIGAVYLDKGYRKTHKFIVNEILKKHVNLEKLEDSEADFKSKLIEWSQKCHEEILFESEEKHKEENKIPYYICSVIINGKALGVGKGNSKKEAEQSAAAATLQVIDSRQDVN